MAVVSKQGPHPQPLPTIRAFTPVFDGLWGGEFAGVRGSYLQLFNTTHAPPALRSFGDTPFGMRVRARRGTQIGRLSPLSVRPRETSHARRPPGKTSGRIAGVS
jgi:hypothetical protein